MGILNRRFARSCFYDSKVDDESIEWLTLNNSVSWDEPKSIGKEKYQYKLKRHDVALYVDAILVKQQDIEQAIQSLKGRNLWGRFEFPSDDWQYLVNREKFWSPAYKDVYRSKSEWENPNAELNVPFIFPQRKLVGILKMINQAQFVIIVFHVGHCLKV